MKTGDVVRDAKGRSYQVGQLLGRGVWGKSYAVRQEDAGVEFVLKCPLNREDFRGDVSAPEDLLLACRDALLEQGRVLEEARWPFLPRLHARFTTADGVPVLLLPKYTTTLERRISDGCPLSEVLTTLTQVLGLLRLLADGPGYHGNLSPGNILLNDRGDVFLTDLATRAWSRHIGRLHAIAPNTNPYLAPEIGTNLGEVQLSPVADTYALGMILYRAVMTPPNGGPESKEVLELPVRGLDKAALLSLKDRVLDHMREEDSNQRFHSRVSDRAAAVLNRAISLETSPSPPFRFNRVEDLLPRMDEVLALIRPEISALGKVILTRPPANDVFETGDEVRFSVAVGTSAGVEDHEEISCGIALFDAESGERHHTPDCAYSADRQPSGRFRFLFQLLELPPGSYRVKLAFAIRDSGHPPVTAESNFEVRAAAGYVPPQREPEPQALPFERPEAEVPMASTPLDPPEETITEGLEQPAPKPIAPTAGAVPPSPAPVAEPPPAAEQAETTFPALAEPTDTEDMGENIPEAVASQSWTELPLPGPTPRELGAQPPDYNDEELPATSRIEQLVELMKEDPYVAFMGAGILLILLLLLALFVLNG